jgi:hypothetical protein
MATLAHLLKMDELRICLLCPVLRCCIDFIRKYAYGNRYGNAAGIKKASPFEFFVVSQ